METDNCQRLRNLFFQNFCNFIQSFCVIRFKNTYRYVIAQSISNFQSKILCIPNQTLLIGNKNSFKKITLEIWCLWLTIKVVFEWIFIIFSFFIYIYVYISSTKGPKRVSNFESFISIINKWNFRRALVFTIKRNYLYKRRLQRSDCSKSSN